MVCGGGHVSTGDYGVGRMWTAGIGGGGVGVVNYVDSEYTGRGWEEEEVKETAVRNRFFGVGAHTLEIGRLTPVVPRPKAQRRCPRRWRKDKKAAENKIRKPPPLGYISTSYTGSSCVNKRNRVWT